MTTFSLCAALRAAAHAGDANTVSRLLDASVEVDPAGINSKTALHYACWNGHVEVAARLIEAGAELHRVDGGGRTPLHVACTNGHVEVVARLIEAGAELDRVDDGGRTPLDVALDNDHGEVVARLIEVGAEVVCARTNGATPLHVAGWSGNVKAASRLLDAGADVGRTDRIFGRTALHLACRRGHVEVAARLIEAGADVNKQDADYEEPIIEAIRNGHLEVVQLLCSHGAKKVFPDIAEYAFRLARVSGHFDIYEWLFRTRSWTARLHHLELLTEAQARAELRAGADLHAASDSSWHIDIQTPLSIARDILAEADGGAPGAAAARLVLRAAEPWSPANHDLFPAEARTRAVELVRIGFKLSRDPRFADQCQAIMDTWLENVMKHAVIRDFTVAST